MYALTTAPNRQADLPAGKSRKTMLFERSCEGCPSTGCRNTVKKCLSQVGETLSSRRTVQSPMNDNDKIFAPVRREHNRQVLHWDF